MKRFFNKMFVVGAVALLAACGGGQKKTADLPDYLNPEV